MAKKAAGQTGGSGKACDRGGAPAGGGARLGRPGAGRHRRGGRSCRSPTSTRPIPRRRRSWSALSRQVDRQVLAGLETGADESTRDRLFDLIMKRFDALAPYRDGLSAVARDAGRDPLAALCGLGQLARSMALMLEAAGVSSSGLAGALGPRGWARSTWRPCATGSATTAPTRPAPWPPSTPGCGGPRAGPAGSTGAARPAESAG